MRKFSIALAVIALGLLGCESTENSHNVYVKEHTYGSFTDERDGQVYKTIVIGEQTWMAQNLNYEVENSYCYADDLKMCKKYGRLYTWAAAIDSVSLANDEDNPLDCGYEKVCEISGNIKGVCPDGWHLPSKEEWTALLALAGDESDACVALRATREWNDYDAYPAATNDLGFSAFAVSGRDDEGHFGQNGSITHFLSSSDLYLKLATCVVLDAFGKARVDKCFKHYAISVRCVQD